MGIAALTDCGDRMREEKRRSRCGQMTVELAVAIPTLIAIALIAFNACTFFAQCAVFDRVAHEAVRVYAISPAYRQGYSQSRSLVEREIKSALDAANVEVSVAHNSTGFDFDKFTATMEFSPTLFGSKLRSEVFGVPMPRLTHSTTFVVDVYKAGVIV